ncbi:MAG: Spy/CpxP family protein refolding chaperone [Desulfomonile tiedjei]|nr:Spy/CpxP family protein refolding chaperone [Desulfomonile tiedjei]
MSKARTGIGICFLVAAILGMSAPGWAAQPMGGQDPSTLFSSPLARLITGNIGRFLVLRSELNVTPEQRAKIAATVKSHRDEIRPVAKSILEKRSALREAVLATTKNDEAIRKAANDLGKAIGDASVLASKVIGEARTALTPEQIERIHKFRAENNKAAMAWVDQIGQ